MVMMVKFVMLVMVVIIVIMFLMVRIVMTVMMTRVVMSASCLQVCSSPDRRPVGRHAPATPLLLLQNEELISLQNRGQNDKPCHIIFETFEISNFHYHNQNRTQRLPYVIL